MNKSLRNGKPLTVGGNHQRIGDRQSEGECDGETGALAGRCSKRYRAAKFGD